MSERNFFAELKRRNVYKVAVAYAVVAWLLIQAASILFPTFEAPGWVMKVFVALVALGLPIALILAWAFELTPEGIKRADQVPPEQSIARSTGRKLDFAIIGVLALAVALLLFDRFRPKQQATAHGSVAAKSIAVLRFENLSRDPDNAFFADGVQEEILTRLAKVEDLKVISRTSTQRYKSKPENLPQIAQQLGVAYLLEGSVQKAGDSVRVHVQLIKAESDAHVWAEMYDRKLTDIFAVESDIAKAVADQLQAKLTGREKKALAERAPVNPVAHQLYVKGRFFWNKRTAEDLRKAIDHFQQALASEPNYALAYAGIAEACVLLPWYSGGRSQEWYPQAKAAAEKALALDDSLAEAHSALAMAVTLYEFDFARAEKEFKRAIELKPNYATAHHWLGNTLFVILGRFDEAVTEVKRALELDPLSLVINTDLASTYVGARRYNDAIEHLRKVIEMDQRFYYSRLKLGQALHLNGALDGAVREYQYARELNDDPRMVANLARAHADAGNGSEAAKLAAELTQIAQQRYVSNHSLAMARIAVGDKDAAIQAMRDAFELAPAAKSPSSASIRFSTRSAASRVSKKLSA